MMELLKNWLLGITCAALVVALAESLTPEGTVRKIGRLTGGLVLLLAIVQPMLQVDGDALARAFTEYRAAMNSEELSLEDTDGDLMKALIEERTCAYIQDKAALLGAVVQIECKTRLDESCPYPVPYEVVVRGQIDQAQREALSRQIEADFAIPAERQTYQVEDVE